ncbi:MAG TPA: tetratricopeptide repeat protein [Acidobacteriota bacterium]|jgi:tetratricopeptide (TPR) repeat protein|nr:tetratricopeptide repeat protein [Acidobacteriota bacterium]
MTKLHRRELKQDEVREKVTEAVRSVSLHGREVFYIIALVVAVGFIAFIWSYYEKNQRQESQKILGTALKKMEAPVGPEATANPTVKPEFSYKTESEKYAAALKDFESIIKNYGNTPAADMARYQAGVCAYYLNDARKAEEYLKQSTKVSDRNILFYLSRIALANFYNNAGRSDEAIKVLKEAIDKNKDLVPQDNLLLELADIYEKTGKTKEARETLQKIVDGYKESPSSFQAQNRLNELKDK